LRRLARILQAQNGARARKQTFSERWWSRHYRSTISFTYAQKWIVIVMAPVLVAGFLLFGVFASNVAESLRKRVRLCDLVARTGDMLVGGTFVFSCL
jgi:hypothetical protein